MKKHLLCTLGIIVFFFFTISGFPKSESEVGIPEKYKIAAWGWLTYGRIEESFYDRSFHQFYDYDGKSLYDLQLGYFFQRNFSERSWGKLHVNHVLVYPIQSTRDKNFKKLKKTIRTRILDASIYLNYFKTSNISADMRIGYFSYKYNPQAMNLGEYLFRSLPYPQYLSSGFETSDKVKIPGVKFGISINESLSQDIFIRSETEMPPVYDFSFSYIVNYRPISLFDISAGVDLYRIISVDESKTSSYKDTSNFNDKAISDKIFTHYMDSTDSIPATFAGNKFMGRVSIDPKWFFSNDIWGKKDLIIYMEALLLGTKNHPTWHTKLLRRVPVMMGVNIPTFKLLDVLSLEFEYFANPYTNSSLLIWEKRSSLPNINIGTSGEFINGYKNRNRDNWKWSLYGSRKIGKFLRFSGQIANDHSQRYTIDGLPIDDITQVTFTKEKKIYWPFKDWYWKIRVMYYI